MADAADLVVVGTVTDAWYWEPEPGFPLTLVLVRVDQSVKGSVRSGEVAISMVGGQGADGRSVYVDGAASRFVLGARVMVFGQDIDGALVRLVNPGLGVITEDLATGQALDGALRSVAPPTDLGGGVLAEAIACEPDVADDTPDAECLEANGVSFDDLVASITETVADAALGGASLDGWDAALGHPAAVGRRLP